MTGETYGLQNLKYLLFGLLQKKKFALPSILSPCLFNLHAEYIMRNAGLEEAQAGIKIAGEISITSDMQMTPPLWQKVKKN